MVGDEEENLKEQLTNDTPLKSIAPRKKEDVIRSQHQKDIQATDVPKDKELILSNIIESNDIFSNDVLFPSSKSSAFHEIYTKKEGRDEQTTVPAAKRSGEPNLVFECDYDGFIIPRMIESSKLDSGNEKHLQHKGSSYIIFERDNKIIGYE